MYPIQVQYCNLQCFLYVSVKICYKWTFPNVGCIFDQFFVRILSFMASAFSQHLSILTAFFFHCPWNKINTKSKSKNFQKTSKNKKHKKQFSETLGCTTPHHHEIKKRRKTEKQKTQKHSQRLLAGPSIHKTSVFLFFCFYRSFSGVSCRPFHPQDFCFFLPFLFIMWAPYPQDLWIFSMFSKVFLFYRLDPFPSTEHLENVFWSNFKFTLKVIFSARHNQNGHFRKSIFRDQLPYNVKPLHMHSCHNFCSALFLGCLSSLQPSLALCVPVASQVKLTWRIWARPLLTASTGRMATKIGLSPSMRQWCMWTVSTSMDLWPRHWSRTVQ